MFVCDSNLHEIFFAVAGPEKTSFEGGVYVLKLALPKDYPMSPPDFHMFTPNGRFQPGAKICTSFTSFHPETWSPAYTINTLIVSFISFFSEEKANALGVVHDPPEKRKRYAKESVEWGRESQYSKKLKIFSVLKNGTQSQDALKSAFIELHGGQPCAEENKSDNVRKESKQKAVTAGPAAVAEVPAKQTPAKRKGQTQNVGAGASIDLTSTSCQENTRKRAACASVDLTGDMSLLPPSGKAAKVADAVVDLT